MIEVANGLKPQEICDRLIDWTKQHMSLSDSDVLIREFGFVNRSPTSTIDNSFRADMALANGRLVGFEIKSKADTLKRWNNQIVAYSNVFDEIWLCCHGKHLAKALEVTPNHIGVMVVDDFGGIAIVRNPSRNNMVNIYDLTGLLWKSEIMDLAVKYGIKVRSSENKSTLRERIAIEIDVSDLKAHILKAIKVRKLVNPPLDHPQSLVQ